MKKIIILTMMLIMLNVVVANNLVLNGIYTDPAIIAAGDEVDLIIKFHDASSSSTSKANDNDWEFNIWIEPDDTMTEKFITIQDAKGDSKIGHLYPGEEWTQVFRIKVKNNAPPGTYEFELNGQYEKNGIKEESIQTEKFKINVKKEGIIIDMANIITSPAEIRPGDDYVKINAYVENAGNKDAKNVEINLDLPEYIESSYSNNNRVYVGKSTPDSQKEINFYLNIDDKIEPGIHNIVYNIEYMDLEDNSYTKEITLPILIKTKPNIIVSDFKGEVTAGSNGMLTITVLNTGTEAAEAVDVRIIKESSQPFDMTVRSSYVGELEPGETGKAIFNIKAVKDAEVKDHDLKLLIRAKGDTDKSDDNIYLFNQRAKIKVNPKEPFNWYYVIIALAIIGLWLAIKKVKK